MMAMRKVHPAHYRRLRQGTFEVLKSGTSRFELRDPYHLAVALPWPYFVAFGLCAIVLINCLFAVLYVLAPGSIQHLPAGDFPHAFFFSLETLSTVGYGEMAPASLYGYAVAALEIIVGMGFIALLTGILFFRFSQSQAGLLFADHAVVSTYNGKPTLMVRVGNSRANMLIEANAKLSILLREVSAEGQVFRRYRDLTLVCGRLPAFPLTWTLMHTVDLSSPLLGYDAEKLRADWGRVFLSVEARDPKLGRTVQDLFDYDDKHVLFGARFVETMHYDEDGVPTADLSKLGEIEIIAVDDADAVASALS